MSALKVQIIGDEIQFDGIVVARLLESSAPPTIMDRAKEAIEDPDPDPDEWVRRDEMDGAERAAQEAEAKAETAEAREAALEKKLDTAVETIDRIIATLSAKDDCLDADPFSIALAADVTEALAELRALKEKLL